LKAVLLAPRAVLNVNTGMPREKTVVEICRVGMEGNTINVICDLAWVKPDSTTLRAVVNDIVWPVDFHHWEFAVRANHVHFDLSKDDLTTVSDTKELAGNVHRELNNRMRFERHFSAHVSYFQNIRSA
jgi:hypothetical protein